MTVGVRTQAEAGQDPRYQQGMVHLQSGDWQDAIRCFEELAQEYPDSRTIQTALEEARFRAGLDATAPRIRPKRWIIPWRPILVRGLILLATAFLAVQGVRLIQDQVGPAIEQLQERQRLARLGQEGNEYFEAGNWDEAEARYGELLTATPEHQEAKDRLAQIDEERELSDLYQQAVALQVQGKDDEALALFSQLQVRRPRYLDSSLRIEEIKQEQDQEALFAKAEAAYEAGLTLEALDLYELIRKRYANYEQDIIGERLYSLYMQLGQGLIAQDPPVPEAIPQALDYFEAALQLHPRSTEASLEKRLLTLYLGGQTRYQAGQWEGAIAQLRTVFDQRPDYLRGTVVDMLYDAYIQSGDQHYEANDCGLAYQRFGQAAALPVADTTVARARRAAVLHCVPPTPTPSATPTFTPTPKPTSPPTATAVPPTPAPTPVPTPWDLATLHNQIVYVSDTEDKPDLWVMDPSGNNRRNLGPFHRYWGQYNAIREAERLSPDGRYRAFVKNTGGSPQVFVYQPPHSIYGPLPDIQISTQDGLNYDPVWSPDGSRIAYVSTESGSDDIWLVYADGKGAGWLVRNDWEWDKHPTWSPDGQRIVFWSNRHGIKQIFIMNADGSQQRPLGSSGWDEYDPIWIK